MVSSRAKATLHTLLHFALGTARPEAVKTVIYSTFIETLRLLYTIIVTRVIHLNQVLPFATLLV